MKTAIRGEKVDLGDQRAFEGRGRETETVHLLVDNQNKEMKKSADKISHADELSARSHDEANAFCITLQPT